MIIGGTILVVDDVVDIYLGVLNPVFPVILASVLAYFVTPWYVGIFYGSAAFSILDIPLAVKKTFFKIPFEYKIKMNI